MARIQPRRPLLRGLFLGMDNETALVKLATPEESTLLSTQMGVVLAETIQAVTFPDPSWLDGPVYVLDGEQFRPIGYITSVQTNHAQFDVSSFDGVIRYVPGLPTVDMRFQGWLGRS